MDASTPPRAAVVFWWAYLLLQIAVPAVQLTDPVPSQFGWQMYSEFLSPTRLEVVTADSVYALDVDSLVLRQRADVRYGERLVEWLCRPAEVERVRLHRQVPRRDLTFPCSRE